jgi:hypothetical protein
VSMQVSKLTTLLLMFILILTTACEQSGESSVTNSPPPATADQERDHVVELVSDNVQTLIEGIEDIVISGDFAAQVEEYIDGEQSAQRALKVMNNSDEDDVEDIINMFFSNPSQNGSTVTYSPNLDVCDDYMAQNNPQTCRASMARVTIVHSWSGNQNGSLQFKFDDFNPFTLKYGSSSLSIQVDLEDIRNLLDGMNEEFAIHEPEHMFENLPTMSGLLEVGMEVTNSQLTLFLKVLSDVSFQISEEGGDINLSIAQSNNAAQLVLNKNAKTVTASINLLAIDANFPTVHQDNEDQDYWVSTRVTLDGVYGEVVLNDINKTLSFNDVGFLGDNKLKLDFDNSRAAEIYVPQYSVMLDATGNQPVLAALSDINATVAIYPHLNNDDNGSMSLVVSNGTVLTVEEYWHSQHDSSPIFQVINGNVTWTGSGDLNGALSTSTGECFTDLDDQGQGPSFPWADLPGCQFN